MTEPSQLDQGTFEVVRTRLDEQGKSLSGLAQQLNARRLELFGGVSTRLLSSLRVRTENNCIPRDIVNVGDRFLLGYQVFMGLKSQITVADVFTELRDDGAGVVNLDPEHPPRLLAEPAFAKDFGEVFQYYKEARLLHLRRTDRLLLAAFQTGSRLTDMRVLRWGLTGHGADEAPRYIDNRGERDYVFPPAHDFQWTRATREQHIQGAHPHVSIDDEIFVECVGGDFTIKVENNTSTGAGVFSEPVDDATQGLDDAEIFYAILPACILLKVRPYRESAWRFVVFNRQTREAVRIDAIGLACQQLPEGHGLVFPGGYYLSTGVHKVFPLDAAGMEYKRVFRAPNGEDVAYVFYRRDTGTYILLQYNLITREMASPVACSSYCRLPDGRLVVLRAEAEPTRVHALQIWQTPFLDEDVAAATAPPASSELAKLGNRELVRAVSDLMHLTRLVTAQKPNRQIYEELLKAVGRVVDTYPWLAGGEGFGIRPALDALRQTAERVIDEFEKVVALTAQAAAKVAAAEKACDELVRRTALGDKSKIEGFVAPLTEVRSARGHAETLKTVRYIEVDRLARLDARLAKLADELARGAVDLLLKPEALAAWQAEIAATEASAAALQAVAEARPVLERIDRASEGLDQLVGIVNALEFSEAAARTAVLERIGETYAQLNRARAVLAGRKNELGAKEAAADFAVQDRLLAQALANAIALCDSPEKCDEFAAKLMIQVEELEGRFADFEQYAAELASRRVDVTERIAARRQALVDERNRRA
ncbi:MAG: DNA repair ATPase, partial [Planctomycetes bacterium]|nr:DNA repair ATPase [Planctomycetota bacterium]